MAMHRRGSLFLGTPDSQQLHKQAYVPESLQIRLLEAYSSLAPAGHASFAAFSCAFESARRLVRSCTCCRSPCTSSVDSFAICGRGGAAKRSAAVSPSANEKPRQTLQNRSRHGKTTRSAH